MQAFIDKQFAFDTYLPGTPHPSGDIADLFPYHIWGRGNIPQLSAAGAKEREQLRRREAVRRRNTPSCIEEACAYGNLSYVILMFAQNKFDVLTRKAVYEGSDASALMWASFKGHLPIVKFLVNAAMRECVKGTADPQEVFDRFINYQSALGHTALQWAIVGGHMDITRYLLDHNADPHHRDRQGFDAAFAAAQNNQLSILMVLLEDAIAAKAVTLVRKGAKHGHGVSAAEDEEDARVGGPAAPRTTTATNEYAVGIASYDEDGGSAEDDGEVLVSGGAVYVVDHARLSGTLPTAPTAATTVATSGAFVVRRTNDYFLDPTLRDTEGHSLLHWAAYRNSPAMCQYLLQRWRYDANVQDVYGRTPLIWAAREGFAEVVELLCLHGANRQLQDKDGFNAAQYTYVRNHREAAHVLRTVPAVNFNEPERILGDAPVLAKVRAYKSVRTRRAYGTVMMILTETLFAVQFVVGALYMCLSCTLMAVAPPMFSYFPYGIYFFKNMLWTIWVRRPEQSSETVKRDIGREVGLASTLAESVRGTWLFRLREPANLVCVVVMMCVQMLCWTQLGLTPFISSFFSFSFLIRPFSARSPSEVSLGHSPLAGLGGSACSTTGADLRASAACQLAKLDGFFAAHAAHFAATRRTAETPFLGSGVNVLAEVTDITSLLSRDRNGYASYGTPQQGSERSTRTAHELFHAASYVGGGWGPLAWVFGDDGVAMVGTVLPLLFTATLVFFFLTKMTAHRSAMRFAAVNEPFQKVKKVKKTAQPCDREGSLNNSPLWRILKSRQYTWLNPRAVLLERHTQIPARACYCPEQDLIVKQYDSYSILLDCPIGASNHLFFLLGLSCFVLFQVCIFLWGVHQMNFFFGMLSDTRCQHEGWTTGLREGMYSAPSALAAYSPGGSAVPWMSKPEAGGVPGRGGAGAGAASRCLGHSWEFTLANPGGLNAFLSLYLHGVPHKQNHYIIHSLLPTFVSNADSLFRNVVFLFYYYWWPTRTNMFGATMLHFAFYAFLMGAAITLRQWSAVWRGATRMELSNPFTPCQNYGGRLIATFALSRIFLSAPRRNADCEHGGDADVQLGQPTRGQLCNVDLDEEHFFESTDPSKARIINPEGIGLFEKSIYAESQWGVVNVMWFLVGRAGAKWRGAMAVSDTLQPVKAPMLPEFQ